MTIEIEDGSIRSDRPVEMELRVIRLVAQGWTDRAIARRLGISVVTVRRWVRRFRNRVGANSRVHAVAIAASRGWVIANANGEIEDSG